MKLHIVKGLWPHLNTRLLHMWGLCYLPMIHCFMDGIWAWKKDTKRHHESLSTDRPDLRQTCIHHLTPCNQRCSLLEGLPRRFSRYYRNLLNTVVHTTAKEKEICYNYVLFEDTEWFDLNESLSFQLLAELLSALTRHWAQLVQLLLFSWWQVTGCLYALCLPLTHITITYISCPA